MRSVAAMLATDTDALITARIRRYLTDHGFDDAAWRAWQARWFSTGLRAVEQRLASDGQTGRVCHGGGRTTPDIVLMSIIVVTRVLKIEGAGTPTINRIAALCGTKGRSPKLIRCGRRARRGPDCTRLKGWGEARRRARTPPSLEAGRSRVKMSRFLLWAAVFMTRNEM